MTADSLAPGRERVTQHMFELPDEPVDLGRWLLDRLLEAERHEACEFLSIGGVRRFWPNHQDEGNPYEIVDRANVQLAHFGCNSSKNNRPTARGEQLRLIG